MPPLSILTSNQRYFTKDGETAVYLIGSPTRANLQDISFPGSPAFPYDEYLDFMIAHSHNITRLQIILEG
jgi:hypothetical protein